REAFKSSGEPWDEAAWAKFAAAVSYVPTDVTKPGGLEQLRKWFAGVEGQGGGRRLYYLSVSPELYPELGTTLGEGGFAKEDGGFRRLIIEKPFGRDRAS